MRTYLKNKKGFTLIELVVVMVLIGSLALIIVPKYVNNVAKGKIATTKANIESIRSAASLYSSNNSGSYPATLATMVPTYLRAVPKEAVTGVSTEVAANNGAGGWVYVAASGDVSVNLAGNDAEGVAYSTY